MSTKPVINAFPGEHHDHRACMAGALRRAERACRARGLRLTPIRRQVLELIWQGHRPVKAYELLERLRESGRSAAPPTVYRALDFLLQAGLIHRLDTLNAYVGCGAPGTSHAGQFLICRACGTVAELDDPAIDGVVSREAGRVGFRVDTRIIELKGLCPGCAASA